VLVLEHGHVLENGAPDNFISALAAVRRADTALGALYFRDSLAISAPSSGAPTDLGAGYVGDQTGGAIVIRTIEVNKINRLLKGAFRCG
jgi:hypothetical protein